MKHRRQLKVLMIGVFALFLAAGLTMSFGTGYAANDTAKKAAGPAVGLKAPDFTLPDLNGQKITLSEIIKSNKLTLVNFWATWCPPCREEIPELISFYRKYSAQKVSLLGIDLQDEPADVRTFAQKNKITYPILTDVEGTVAQTYNIYAIPTTFFVDSNGKIRDKIEGGTDMETLEQMMRNILKD